MPDFHHLLLFIAAGLLLNLTPGPDVMFIVANAVRAGARAGVAAALGISAGCLVHVAAAALGVSALLAASSAAPMPASPPSTARRRFSAAHGAPDGGGATAATHLDDARDVPAGGRRELDGHHGIQPAGHDLPVHRVDPRGADPDQDLARPDLREGTLLQLQDGVVAEGGVGLRAHALLLGHGQCNRVRPVRIPAVSRPCRDGGLRRCRRFRTPGSAASRAPPGRRPGGPWPCGSPARSPGPPGSRRPAR